MTPYGPPCPFRAIGYTWKAGLFPGSPQYVSIIAQHNGIAVDKLPWAYRFAPNRPVLDWLHRLGSLQDAGLDVRPNARWLTMKQLDILEGRTTHEHR